MPRYFFEITTNGKSFRDDNAMELADLDAAWEEATASAGQIIRDLDGSLKPGTEWAIVVEDEFRNKLRTLAVSVTSHK